MEASYCTLYIYIYILHEFHNSTAKQLSIMLSNLWFSWVTEHILSAQFHKCYKTNLIHFWKVMIHAFKTMINICFNSCQYEKQIYPACKLLKIMGLVVLQSLYGYVWFKSAWLTTDGFWTKSCTSVLPMSPNNWFCCAPFSKI